MKRALASMMKIAQTVSKANGPSTSLINDFVNEVRSKVTLIADNLAQKANPEATEEEMKVEATKLQVTLLGDVQAIFVEEISQL